MMSESVDLEFRIRFGHMLFESANRPEAKRTQSPTAGAAPCKLVRSWRIFS